MRKLKFFWFDDDGSRKWERDCIKRSSSSRGDSSEKLSSASVTSDWKKRPLDLWRCGHIKGKKSAVTRKNDFSSSLTSRKGQKLKQCFPIFARAVGKRDENAFLFLFRLLPVADRGGGQPLPLLRTPAPRWVQKRFLLLLLQTDRQCVFMCNILWILGFGIRQLPKWKGWKIYGVAKFSTGASPPIFMRSPCAHAQCEGINDRVPEKKVFAPRVITSSFFEKGGFAKATKKEGRMDRACRRLWRHKISC